ncbi:DUF4062 domain-containing protein [Butyricimonas paravirosa]|uniref:DUF4062 domain-containing protein n=1 Tax=Butyricimonas paravirosa TaxID=1472417 RepID=UPI0022E641FE|nr:DUF4062 domain-containing protein [Butyricimonas paravirosa]
MAIPRIFVSSTCYDLKEIRFQLRNFIHDFGYEAVNSEFGDIFFDYKKHVQESCKIEISKCNMFILIIGNAYGSLYYDQVDKKEPDSVTLQEFKEALEVNIPKHIFINKFVEYDYQNYCRAWEKELRRLITNQKINPSDAELVHKTEEEYKKVYPFPQESYKHLFKFINLIYDTGHAVITYESFDDIKNNLRKQWAGVMYEFLTQDRSVPKQFVQDISLKIDRLNDQLYKLFETKKNGTSSKITFDISQLIDGFNFDEVENIRDTLFDLLSKILNFDNSQSPILNTGTVFSYENVIEWMKDLVSKVDIYKWSKFLDYRDVFDILKDKFYNFPPYRINSKTVLKFISCVQECEKKLDKEEYRNMVNNVIVRTLNQLEEDDGLPF